MASSYLLMAASYLPGVKRAFASALWVLDSATNSYVQPRRSVPEAFGHQDMGVFVVVVASDSWVLAASSSGENLISAWLASSSS